MRIVWNYWQTERHLQNKQEKLLQKKATFNILYHLQAFVDINEKYICVDLLIAIATLKIRHKTFN
jgi:hypothetical protein